MKTMSWTAVAAVLAGLCAAPAVAADAAAKPAAAPVVESPATLAADRAGNEPAVQRTVIDDASAHIEELRVRGQLQKVTVDPRGRAPGYEIIVGDASRDISEGRNTSRGATGKRVWNVLRF
ncbi:MAG: hypothetical protein ABI699_02440 [Caldimonas sp.]